MALLYAYNFDEASGAVVDYSGNGLNVTLTGSLVRTASAGGHSGTGSDKGLSQSTAAADSAGPTITGLQTAQFTVMAWVKRSSNSVDGWFAELKASGSGDRGILFSSGAVQSRVRNAAGSVQFVSTTQPTAGTWYHVAGSYSTVDGKIHLYINGTEVGTGTTLSAPLKSTSTGSHLLDTLGSETVIDDLRYYDTALDAATITTLMGQPVDAGGTTGTVAVTQANQTSTASGQLGYTGSAAANQAANTATAAGKLGYSGSAAANQASQTAAASGTFTAGGVFAGAVAVTQAGQTSSASGQLGYSGTVARTQANNTSAASGTVANPVTGTASALQANQTASIVGQFAALVAFGTASAAVGQSPAASAVVGQASTSSATTAGSATASSGAMTVPTATGG